MSRKKAEILPVIIKIVVFFACVYLSGCGASRPKIAPLPAYLTDVDTTFVVAEPFQPVVIPAPVKITQQTPVPVSNRKSISNNAASLPETVVLENHFLHEDKLAASIGDSILKIAKSLSAQRLMYNPKPSALRDCSGIFHRVLNELRRINDKWEFPHISRARSSRTIAEWYEKRGEFVAITDPVKQSYLLEPGAILFFSSKRPASSNVSFKELQKTIQHLGIAVITEKDRKNSTNRYHLFHGRSRGKVAAITKWHLRKNRPPFGNGRQHWVGYARLVKAPESMILTITPEMRQLQQALVVQLPHFSMLSCFRFTYIF